MKHYIFVLISFLLLISSCKKEDKKNNTPIQKTGMDIPVTYAKPAQLDNTSSKEIKKWKEYFIVADFITQLENTTPTEALNNALELKTLTKQLKDSLNIKTLQTPAFKARINVFENEVLRLADITYISSITSKEVNNHIKKIHLLFGGINTKINTVYAKKRFDKAIKLDSLFNF
ncbi:hypothetical protein [Tenacibaculum aestuariivivum]|uniref:hypothetical protein n=1 Tax=Tenacibaculum aestuariivivum TaxID=2006131 RepID=UPI003AB6AE93